MPVEMNYIMPDGEDPYAMPDDVGRMPGGGDGRPRAANGTHRAPGVPAEDEVSTYELLLQQQMTKEARIELLERELARSKAPPNEAHARAVSSSSTSAPMLPPPPRMPPPRPQAGLSPRFAAEPGTAAQAVRQQGAGVEGRGIFERIQTIADGQTMPHTVPTGVPVQPRSPPAVPVSSVQKLHPASGLQVQLGQPLPAGTVAPVSSGPLSTARQMTGAQGVTAEIVFADSHGGKAAGRQGDAITLSSRDLQHPTVSNLAPDDSAQPAVLQGYNADLVQPQLRYGDSISLLPDGRNSIVAFGGDYEGRAWAEMLDKEVGVPPNVRDCEWCLEPKRQYVEARKLAKLIKTSDWDDGKNLPLPRTPQHGENLEEYANEIVSTNKLNPRKVESVRDILIALRMKMEEHEGNLAEMERQRGNEIRFGSAVILVHRSTGMVLTLMKQRAIEDSAKRVQLHAEGSNCSIFVVKPAFKTYAEGSPICSGDVVTFETQKTVAGSHYTLHVSSLVELHRDRGMVTRSLKTNHGYIEGGQELNGIAASVRPTLFRMMLFRKLEYAGAENTDLLKGEDVIAFYHKHFSAYLAYDPELSTIPVYYASERISAKSRKKCAWMWKIEGCSMNEIAAPCASGESSYYRIKHVVSNMYLVAKNKELHVTADYKDENTLFTFKHFYKLADASRIQTDDMVFIRGRDGSWLIISDQDDDDDHRTMPIELKPFDMVPDSDALLIMPFRPSALAAVVQVRRLVLVLQDLGQRLKQLPDCSPANPPPGGGSAAVQAIVDDVYERVYSALRTLVVNCSFGDDPDPMSRDGKPNKMLQKILRELGAINQVVDLLQVPFQKGVELDALAGKHAQVYKKLVTLLNMMYRLLKQIVKGNLRNARALHKHLDTLRKHLGKGILVTPTIKEIFAGKRELLILITEEVIDHFIHLLKVDKAPQYIDFLMSICTCPEPLAKVQAMVADRLLVRHPELLPNVRMESKDGQVSMLINVPGTKDEIHNGDLWLDMAAYKATKEVRGRKQDYVGWIMKATLSELSQKEKIMRYFIRCSNLYSKLATGRNQASLRALICSPVLSLSYQQILSVCKAAHLPYLLRARYFTIMSKLYVDRDPQSHQPQVMYTRVWSRVKPEPSDLDMSGTPRGEESESAKTSIPVCTTGFKDLQQYLLQELPNCADCKDVHGKPSLNGEPRIGQLEMVSAMLSIVDELVGFGFFFGERPQEGKDNSNKGEEFSQLQIICEALFRVLDARDPAASAPHVSTDETAKREPPTHVAKNEATQQDAKAKTRTNTLRKALTVKSAQASDTSDEALFRNDLRVVALNMVLRLFNVRLNARISRIISVWETVFDRIEGSSAGLARLNVAPQFMSVTSTRSGDAPASSRRQSERDFEEQMNLLRDTFAEFDDEFKRLNKLAFGQVFISPETIGSDIYRPFDHKDSTIEVMLELCTFKHADMTKSALTLLFRNMTQKVTCFEALKDVQILVFPAAVTVYHETQFAIKRLGGLHKHVNADRAWAYDQAIVLLKRLSSYLVESPSNKKVIVEKNQKIMLNLDIDKSVRNLLSLHLGREKAKEEYEADIPSDPRRRDLFQACYTFLLHLVRNFPKAQEKMYPFIKIFKEHMGVEKLNVADTISEIVADNMALCAQTPEDFLRHFIFCLKVWGRRARWLSFFQYFILVRGSPVKRNQDLILRLLMEDVDILDLTCDYSSSDCKLAKSDERFGMTRIQLLLSDDHHRAVFSLLKYHAATLNVLALCCRGKNAENQGKICALLPLDVVTKNILYVDYDTNGEKVPSLTADQIRYVQAPWIGLLVDVYLLNIDSQAIAHISQSKDFYWQDADPMSDSSSARDPNRRYLVGEFGACISALAMRLQGLDAQTYHGAPETLNSVKDAHGEDVGQHLKCVIEMIKAGMAYFSRLETLVQPMDRLAVKEQASAMFHAAVKLYSALAKFGFDKVSTSVVELITCLTSQGVDGPKMELQESEEVEETRTAGRELCFQKGWQDFRTYAAHQLGISPKDGEAMNDAVKDIAVMIGSRTTHQNEAFQSLREVMKMLCDRTTDDRTKVLGLKAMRAILYMNPDHEPSSPQDLDKEFRLMLENQPPSSLGETKLARAQITLAKLGGVDVVSSCIESDNAEVVISTLRFAVTLLDGGNPKVQELFASALKQASSAPFFAKFRSLFKESVEAIREQKRKLKQAELARAAMAKAGIQAKAAAAASHSLAESQRTMVEVMKTMRRMCMGQFRPLQEILRSQRLNYASYDFFNEAVQYVKMLEPEIKDAIHDGEFEIVEGAMRAFLMLADAMRGPNAGNQKAIAETGIFDLCDRLFARILFEHVDANSPDYAWERKKNDYRCKLKCAVTECLNAFLEGVEDDVIINQMLQLLNWYGVVDQMKACYTSYERGTDHDQEQLLEEGISYYFLLKHMKNYDKGNQKISPAMGGAPAKVINFYDRRCAYIEIVRYKRLERCYFQLPEKCIVGGPFDRRSFEEMFAVEQREEFDKKNSDYVQNMIHIVDKVNFHETISKTKLAWTVNKWDLIKQANFYFTVLLHTLLIFGGYMPVVSRDPRGNTFKSEYQERIEAQDGTGDRRKSSAGTNPSLTNVDDSSEDTALFDLTESDIYNFNKVEPAINTIARVMNWMNLITCGIRFFAFAHAELPIIIRRAIEEAEEEEEVEDDEDAMEQEEEEPEEEPLDVVFVEHVNQSSQAAAGKDKRDPEIEVEVPAAKGLSLLMKNVWFGVTSPAIQYEVLFTLFPVIGIITGEPLFSGYALFEICSWKGSKTVIDAIVINFAKMAQALLLGLLFMYVWMILGMMLLRHEHQEDMCSNMFQCFFAYIFLTIRDNGVREVLTAPSEDFKFPHNMVDALIGKDVFMVRIIWDVAFQIIFIYILLAIITGIVIDAFGALKEQKEADEDDLKSICFVCNVDRFTADQKGIGFDKHVKQEHFPKWYLFFLIYLQRKPKSKLTGQENYVKDLVWPPGGKKHEIHWLPREQTFTIHVEDEDEDAANTNENLSAKVDSLAAAIARIEAGMNELKNAKGPVGGTPSAAHL